MSQAAGSASVRLFSSQKRLGVILNLDPDHFSIGQREPLPKISGGGRPFRREGACGTVTAKGIEWAGSAGSGV